jgi:diaminohydroxyphosphoribosylaminopyrimidine deaminase/5-amino-6-(5-phosphoribosylamino)uracil reductase
MKTDEDYMRIALREARKGLGRTSPNPCVGAVIVKDGQIISRGYHQRAGTPHAEINAIRNARESINGATMYVTLEPCSHTGKTPPCCEALVQAGLKRVVIGMQDPNPLVDGRGRAFLEQHNIAVSSGVLEASCRRLNDWFIKFIQTKRPWMIMKAGISLDGRLNYQTGQQGWITGSSSLRQVHVLRDRVDAIMVGRGTVAVDNPALTARIDGRQTKDPVRIILDSHLQLPVDCQVFHVKSSAATWVCCRMDASLEKKAEFQRLGVKILELPASPHGLDLLQLVERLGREGICSVLVEGGARLHGSFLQTRLYDYAYLFIASRFAGDSGDSLTSGLNVAGRDSAPIIEPMQYRRFGRDILLAGNICYK